MSERRLAARLRAALARRIAPTPGRDDTGSVTLFVVLMSTLLLAMAGLVIDGGYALDARQEAANLAEQAARAGADSLSDVSLRAGGPVRVNPAQARAAANSYLAAAGHAGTVTVNEATVTVSVRISKRTAILSAVGVNQITVVGTASANSIAGIVGEEP